MVRSVQRVRNSLGMAPRASQEIVPFVNKGMRELYLKCFDDYLKNISNGNSDIHLNYVQSIYEKDYLDNVCVSTKLYDGVSETLSRSSDKFCLVCVTNKPEKHSTALLKALKVLQHFSLVVGGDTCAEAKPSSLPLKHAMEKLNLENTKQFRKVMIGDSVGDLICGFGYQAEVAWCSWGYLSEVPQTPEGKWPNVILSRPQSLLKFLGLE
jgi:phosphoglycolate phosphatase